MNVLGKIKTKTGKAHQKSEVYSTSGGGSLMCSLIATCYKDPPKILICDMSKKKDERYVNESQN